MTGADVPRPERFISASELGEYAYCRRAWWLRAVRGVTTEAQGNRLSAGHAAHRRESSAPWLRDVVQLAAYCLLLEETEPRFAGYGYLRYAHRTFRIDFTDRVRGELLRTIADMRADLTADDVPPNHHDPRRCVRCMLVRACGQAVLAAP